MTKITKNSSDLLKAMLLATGFAKIYGQKVTENIVVRKLIDSGLVTVSSRVTLSDVLLVLAVPEEEVSILKKVYEKGEICVSEVIGKVKLSRMRKWIETGLVCLEKREGKLFLIKN